MLQEYVSEIIAFLPTVGLAIAWIYTQHRNSKKSEREAKLSEADRERAYSDRMEQRLREKERELEYALTQLMEAKLNNTLDPEAVLKEIIDKDPGLMFAKRRMNEHEYQMVRVSAGYARKYLGGPKEFYDNKTDTEIWGDELGKLFNDADERVYKGQIGIHVEEPADSKLTQVKGYFVGRKFPIRLGETDYVIGIGEHVNSLNKRV